ncbi:hypothetical protein OSTOST_18629 [Ostertagia ostertagi]
MHAFQALSSLAKPPVFAGVEPLLFDVVAWKFTVVFLSLQLILHWILPHDNVYLLSSTGDRKKPVNGFSSCLLLCLLYVMGSGLGIYRNDLLFIHFESVIVCMAVVCVTLWLIMLINYRLGEYYNVLDIDLKHFVRSRITLVMFPVLYCSSVSIIAHTQKSISLLSCCVLTVAAFVSIYMTTVIDKQKYDFRRSKGFIKNTGVDRYISHSQEAATGPHVDIRTMFLKR